MHNLLAQTAPAGVGVIAVAGLTGMGALVWKVVDFLRLVTNLPATRSSVLTQLAAWAGGLIVTFLYSESQLGDIAIPGTALTVDRLNLASLVIVGLALGSAVGVGVDLKQAVDATDSAAKPALLPKRRKRHAD